MTVVPELKTERLLLRGFRPSDKHAVYYLAADKDIASTTLSIPHPFKLKDAEKWLQNKAENFNNNHEIGWAVCRKDSNALIGAIGLRLEPEYESAEMGFWIGKPFWGNGFVTEAGKRVLEYAFNEMELNRVEAKHMVGNDASGRVIEKLGMQYEGLHRQLIKKWDKFKDVKSFAILKSDVN